MITNDVTRLMTRWFSHTDHGVAAMLALLPREKPGSATPDPLPAMPAIYDDVDTEGIAGAEIDPPSSPALVLYASRPAKGVAERGDRQGARRVERVENVIVTAGYLTQDGDPGMTVRNGGYVLRAAHWSALRMNNQKYSEGYREVNGVSIAEIGPVTEYAVAGAVGACKLWGFIQIPVKALYTVPQ